MLAGIGGTDDLWRIVKDDVEQMPIRAVIGVGGGIGSIMSAGGQLGNAAKSLGQMGKGP